jgi:hypothetical protein
MYILANQETVIKFPYSILDLIKDNPTVSFHDNMNSEELEPWSVFKVEEQTPPPIDDATESLEQGTPTFVDGKWKQNWIVVKADSEEIERRYKAQSTLIRTQRNSTLDATDYTQMPDYQCSESERNFWISFRQSLRDIPSQPGFPWQIEWPEIPAEVRVNGSN